MNIIYIVAPALTVRMSPVAEAFMEALNRTLQEYGSVSILRAVGAMLAAEPDNGDGVVLFNRPDTTYESQTLKFITKAIRGNAVIFPVASTKDERYPPPLIQDRQSFDVVEHLRQRALDESQIATVATVFARQVLSIVRPTLSVEPMHLFLSHRRLDGEEITASFHNSLLITSQQAFRDLFDVRVGEDAQAIIEKRLRESDAVLFLDTPKAGQSEWIVKELQMALSLQLPIVWIRLGNDDHRVHLPIKPSGTPHFSYPDLDVRTEAVDKSEVEKIVQKAFDIHHRDYVDRLLDEFGTLRDVAHKNGLSLNNIDPRRMIYSLTLPRKTERYRQRPLTHLIQLFGRTPTAKDLSAFPASAKNAGFETHPKHGAHYDSAILLAASPSRANPHFDECGIHTDSIGDYVAEIERVASGKRTEKKRLLISGAFADCEPEFQQNMTNAVHAFAEASLIHGGGLVFGAHPTFQFMIFDLAKRLKPTEHLAFTRMYVSRFFVTESAIDEFRASAEVVPVNAVQDDRTASLTAMRAQMVDDKDVGALVVIGGKTAKGGHTPGVDEEVELARKAGLRIFIIGSVGGRSSELSSQLTLAERASMSGLQEERAEDLARSLDYGRLARMIIDSSL